MRSLASKMFACLATAVLATPAAAQTTVRYSEVMRSIFYLPSYVADAKGFFKEQGLSLNMTTAWGSEKIIPLLLTGSVDIGLLGPESQVYIENSPSPTKTKIFCKLTAKDGLILVSRAKMSADKFQWNMLKGKSFLDWRPGITPHVDAQWVLRKHGLDPAKDFDHITNVGTANRDAAWLSGKGDFGTFFEPTVSRFELAGKGYAVASIGDEIGPFAFTVFMATDKFIAENPKVVQGWCNAIRKAMTFVDSTGPAELSKLAAPYFPQLDHALLISSIKRYKDLGVWSGVTTDEKDVAKMQDILIAGGIQKADQRVPYERMVTRTFSNIAEKQFK